MVTIGEVIAANSLDTDMLADVSIEDFTIYGYKDFAEGQAAEIHNLITDASIVRTIDGAPTLSVDVLDPTRLLAVSQLLTYRITMVLDTFAFELAQVKKTGDSFSLTFEEVLVAEMRRRNTPRKIAPETMSRVEFAYLLLSELPAVDFVTPPIDLELTHVELARGKDKVTVGATLEDTWKALTRIFGDVKWRFWVDKGKVFAATDSYLIGLPSAGQIREYSGGVDDIDYDIDSGKPISKATFNVVSGRWGLPIGARVDVLDNGPQNGSWIVSEIRRSLFSKIASVTLVRPVQPLPEPPAQQTSEEAVNQSSVDVAVAVGTRAGVAARAAGAPTGGTADAAVRFALSKEGGPYVWGGNGPTGYDCSGLFKASFESVGVRGIPRVSHDQYDWAAAAGGAISVAEAANTRGAMLERSPFVHGDSGHIAISLGTGNETIEAMGPAYGIRQGKISGRGFNHGARVPGVSY